MLLCDLRVDCPSDQSTEPWQMDWYLAFPSGPHDTTSTPAATAIQSALNGYSDQRARLYTVPLGGTGESGHLGNVTPPIGGTYTFFTEPDPDSDFDHSFFSDVIAVDYDLDFKTDTLYFGSVDNANTDQTNLNTGGMHRLVLGEDANDISTNPWTLNTLFKTPGHQPVSGALR